jgi:hypothetical protein
MGFPRDRAHLECNAISLSLAGSRKPFLFAWALGQAQPVSARCGTVKSDPRRYNPVTLEFEMNATIEGPLSDHALRRCVCRKVISSRFFQLAPAYTQFYRLSITRLHIRSHELASTLGRALNV